MFRGAEGPKLLLTPKLCGGNLVHTHTVTSVRVCVRVCVCVFVSGSQQQPPDEVLTGLLWILTLDFSEAPAVAPGPILFLISAAMVMKACSTLVELLALVSRKGIPRVSANSCSAAG